jgi:two-component system sensor histidine kinase MtrB
MMREMRGAMAGVALGVVVLTAGCAQIPTSGSPAGAAITQVAERPGNDPAVRVFAEGPHPGDSVYSIVAGFLEASGTVEDGLSTAHEYLTAAAATRWRPGNGVNVYDQTAVRLAARATDRLEFTAPASGTVDDQGVFLEATPGRSLLADFGLVRVDGNWRIDSLPDGLFVSRQDFDREYIALDLHFLAAGKATPVLVPDPIHLRRDAELPTALAAALLRGPSRWLSRAVCPGR